jgi:3-carboxy-cis,cis-muconate cycloisomerase
MCSNEFSEGESFVANWFLLLIPRSVQEPFVPHRGASSTMPQKRNPISSEAMLAASKLLRNHASAAQDAMVADFERASGPWHLEWVCVPEAFCVASGALAHAEFALGGLCVDVKYVVMTLVRSSDTLDVWA